MKTIYLGADHAGFFLKNAVKDALMLKKYDVEDVGAHTFAPTDDYPIFAKQVAQKVQKHAGSMGILLCGSAEGMCMAANKFIGIRAGIGFSQEAAMLMRQDDDANILCLPARTPTHDDPFDIIFTFLETPFSKERRHIRRIAAIE